MESRINPDQAENPNFDHAIDSQGELLDENKEESQVNGKADTANAISPDEDSRVKSQSPEKSTSTSDRPSKRVQEGQRYNNRDRKYNSIYDRTTYRSKNKSDLTSQKESSNPGAIRKQVGYTRVSAMRNELMTTGGILLFRFQSPSGQISLYESRRPPESTCPH